jgi:hypothetical protein
MRPSARTRRFAPCHAREPHRRFLAYMPSVGREEIERTTASDLASVLVEQTGIALQGGHPAGAGVMLQGLGSERLLILLDGQSLVGRISGVFDVSRIPTSAIDRIEVVKGPQSTLYSSEAMGGVINIITRTPAAEGARQDCGRSEQERESASPPRANRWTSASGPGVVCSRAAELEAAAPAFRGRFVHQQTSDVRSRGRLGCTTIRAIRMRCSGRRARHRHAVRRGGPTMSARMLVLVALLGASTAACRYQPSPLTLQGSPPEIAALAGEWAGEYSGTQSGRSGSISLHITAGGDTAYGDVVMVTNTGQRPVAAHQAGEHLAHARSADVLRISFVRVAQGRVTGLLEPYVAPDCQCRVTTSFTGTVGSDVIEGTFTTRGPGGLEQSGRWRVSREKS